MNAILNEMNLSCSTEELFTLVSLLGGDVLVGVPDPFPGWLTEEIAEAMAAAQTTLVEHGYLMALADGKVQMDVLTAAQIGAMAAPQAVFLLTSTVPGEMPRQVVFYHRAPITVLLERNGDQYHLKSLSSENVILSEIKEFWKLDQRKAVDADSISVPQAVLQSVQEIISAGRDKIQKRLEEAGVAKENARALAITLTSSELNGALVSLRPQPNSWDVGGLGILSGENGQWLLRSFSRQQTDWVGLTPSSDEKIIKEIEALLRHYLSFGEN